MQNKEENEFNYTYVALTEQQRREVASIRRHYEPEDGTAALSRIKRLDARVKNIPTVIALILGVVGMLLFGAGMALVLEFSELVWGIVTSAVGILPIAAAYPAFLRVSAHLNKKYAPEILRLSDELLGKK